MLTTKSVMHPCLPVSPVLKCRVEYQEESLVSKCLLSVFSLLMHEMKKLNVLFLLLVSGLVFLLQRHDS